jgi:hypothetical protein
LPIVLLGVVGAIGIAISVILGVFALGARVWGSIPVPGYTAIVLMLVFSLSVILLALGIVGSYVWRTFDNSKGRPSFVPLARERFGGKHSSN